MGHVAVLGAGSWGTALARHLALKGHQVRLWVRSPALAGELQRTRVNAPYLPGAVLPSAVHPTADLRQALASATSVFFVVPSHGLREVARVCAGLLEPGAAVVSATKGIENGSLMLMTQVLADELGAAACGGIAALGGPSFAREVAQGLPTAVCVASSRPERACELQELLASERFRVYTTDDVIGVELGGALKNVIAIAAGTADGLGFGHNARAGLITRGVAEISRLAIRLGAHPQTLSGLSGMGDLVLTCTGDLSRNRAVGIELGKGRGLREILGQMNMVAEGVRTADSACALARREGVEMPIIAEVYNVLHQNKPALAAVESLLGRALRPERDS
jgi:glycerol-3-phosphate dehydrogenase (NAD(P)+)